MANGNGISNVYIKNSFENEKNDDLKKNFMGVYSSNSITKYINFYEIIKAGNAKYLFAIFNTGRENIPRTHWWSFLDIYPKKDFLLFDSFGFTSFEKFIIDNDLSVIDKLLFNLQKFNEKDSKINLVSLTFSIESYQKMKEKSLKNLTDTAKDFFHLLSKFGKLKKQKQEMKIVLLDDQLQELTTDTCGIFELYFYKNLFEPSGDSKIINN